MIDWKEIENRNATETSGSSFLQNIIENFILVCVCHSLQPTREQSLQNRTQEKSCNSFQEERPDEVLFLSSQRPVSWVLGSPNKSKEAHGWKPAFCLGAGEMLKQILTRFKVISLSTWTLSDASCRKSIFWYWGSNAKKRRLVESYVPLLHIPRAYKTRIIKYMNLPRVFWILISQQI